MVILIELAAFLGASRGLPAFVAAQANVWPLTPTDLYDVMTALQALNPDFVFVRPDHFFQLAREAEGLPNASSTR
jgi:hypothetical protein